MRSGFGSEGHHGEQPNQCGHTCDFGLYFLSQCLVILPFIDPVEGDFCLLHGTSSEYGVPAGPPLEGGSGI